MEGDRPVLWTETETWAEVARLAAEKGLRLAITDDPDHPENPWLRLVDEPEGPASVTPSSIGAQPKGKAKKTC
jgi:hypothetical protein